MTNSLNQILGTQQCRPTKRFPRMTPSGFES
jgi:hypothetical protein